MTRLLAVRQSITMLAVGGMAAALVLAPNQAQAEPGQGGGTPSPDAAALGLQTVSKAASGEAPKGANPYLALVPNPERVDWSSWKRWLARQSAMRAAAQLTTRQKLAVQQPPILVDEDEPAGMRGSNDTPATAQVVPGFGTAAGRNPKARILGQLSPEGVQAEPVAPNVEDDGSIPLARDTGISAARDGITTAGEIGDGPHGSAGDGTGDFDVYRLDVTAGRVLTVDVDTPTGDLDSMVALYDDQGEIVAFNDDFEDFDSLLTYQFTADGTYFVLLTGFPVLPEDPFGAGSGTGAASEGPYDVSMTVADPDVDFFAIRLRKGDVLGASVEGAAANLAVWDTVPRNVHGSEQDASFIYPADSPLPGGGNAVTDYVAETTGLHYVAASVGDGSYDITVEAYRPGLERNPPAQTLFLDFDGARVNTAIYGGPGVRTLSPFQAFLGRWGLTRADENALINRIVAVVRENVRNDLVASGLNGAFKVRIRNSRDNPDPWGGQHVTRVVVGGTIDQSGIPTIGIAQSIDPGNYEQEETALVLLDVLSDPAGDPASLNTYLKPTSHRIRFVGQAVGNVVSHEVGHMFGNWHVDQFNDVFNLMDQGGEFTMLYGVGPDGIGGTADDPDVDFGEDTFNPFEGFTGIEDTLARVAFAATS